MPNRATELDNDPPIINDKPFSLDPFGLLTDEERAQAQIIKASLVPFEQTIEIADLDPSMFLPCGRAWRRNLGQHGIARYRVYESGGVVPVGTLACEECHAQATSTGRPYYFYEVQMNEPLEGWVRCLNYDDPLRRQRFVCTAPDGFYLIQSETTTLLDWQLSTDSMGRFLRYRNHAERSNDFHLHARANDGEFTDNTWARAIQDNWERAGRDFARFHNRCFGCNERPLRSGIAQETGLGPCCRERVRNAVLQ